MAARITRAKKRIATNRIPLTMPEDPHEREHRLPLVLTAISLGFTEGYAATSGDAPIRRELTGEASRLARSEEHTSELQSRGQLVCRRLLAKKQATRRGRVS